MEICSNKNISVDISASQFNEKYYDIWCIKWYKC